MNKKEKEKKVALYKSFLKIFKDIIIINNDNNNNNNDNSSIMTIMITIIENL